MYIDDPLQWYGLWKQLLLLSKNWFFFVNSTTFPSNECYWSLLYWSVEVIDAILYTTTFVKSYLLSNMYPKNKPLFGRKCFQLFRYMNILSSFKNRFMELPRESKKLLKVKKGNLLHLRNLISIRITLYVTKKKEDGWDHFLAKISSWFLEFIKP